MRKFIIIGIILINLNGNLWADVYTSLTDGITKIVSPGTPGPISDMYDPAWKQIIGGDDDTSSPNVTMIARIYKNGRVVVHTLGGTLNKDYYDNKKLNQNITNWLNQKGGKSVALSNGHSEFHSLYGKANIFIEEAKASGYSVTTIETLNMENLQSIDVLVIGNAWSDFLDEEIIAVESFVKEGGGLLLTGLGWSWMGYHQYSTMEDYPMAKMCLAFKCKFLDHYVNDPTDKLFADKNDSPIFHTFYPNVQKDNLNKMIPKTVYDSLIELYKSTNGDNWKIATNWCEERGSECSWYGITCNRTNTNIVHINLSNNNLSGILSDSSINNLTEVNYLILMNNKLSGDIPDKIENLKKMTYLNLNYNQLSGNIPESIGNLSNLTF